MEFPEIPTDGVVGARRDLLSQGKSRIRDSECLIDARFELRNTGHNIADWGYETEDHPSHGLIVVTQNVEHSFVWANAKVPGAAEAKSRSGRLKNIFACRDQPLEDTAGLHCGPHPAQDNSYPPAPKPNLRASTAGFRLKRRGKRPVLPKLRSKLAISPQRGYCLRAPDRTSALRIAESALAKRYARHTPRS